MMFMTDTTFCEEKSGRISKRNLNKTTAVNGITTLSSWREETELPLSEDEQWLQRRGEERGNYPNMEEDLLQKGNSKDEVTTIFIGWLK